MPQPLPAVAVDEHAPRPPRRRTRRPVPRALRPCVAAVHPATVVPFRVRYRHGGRILPTGELLREVTDQLKARVRDQLGELRGEQPPVAVHTRPPRPLSGDVAGDLPGDVPGDLPGEDR